VNERSFINSELNSLFFDSNSMSKMPDRKNPSDDVDSLREEFAKLKDEVHRLSQTISPDPAKPSGTTEKRGFGQSLSEYINDVVQSVTSGISAEIEKSVLVDPTGAWFDRHIAKIQSRTLSSAEAERAASLMSAMASAPRLRILTELIYGGRYASELEGVLKELSPSTISNHLKILEESGLVVQEGDRGRYLITLPGRIALKMATRLGRFLERRKS
jgi:DNA-binding transcriptional ArsR family regulator